MSSRPHGFTALRASLDKDGPQSSTAINLLEGLLLQLQTQVPLTAVASPLEAEVQGWLNAILATPQGEWNLVEQADILAVSHGHRLFSRRYGISPAAIRREVQLLG